MSRFDGTIIILHTFASADDHNPPPRSVGLHPCLVLCDTLRGTRVNYTHGGAELLFVQQRTKVLLNRMKMDSSLFLVGYIERRIILLVKSQS